MIGCHRLWLVTGRLWLVTGRLWHFVTGRLLVKTHNNDDGDFQSWCWPKASNSMIWWLPITQNHSNLSKASLPQLLLAGFSIHQRHNHLLLNRCVPGFVFIFRFVFCFHFLGSLHLYLHFYLNSDDYASPSLVTEGIFSITSSDAEISSFKVGARARQADWGDVLCSGGEGGSPFYEVISQKIFYFTKDGSAGKLGQCALLWWWNILPANNMKWYLTDSGIKIHNENNANY